MLPAALIRALCRRGGDLMYRIKLRHVLLLLLLVVVAGLGLVAYRIVCGGPTLTVKGDAQSKDFETRFLGCVDITT